MWKKLLPLTALFFFPLFAGAQEAKPIIRFSPLYTEGVNIEEARLIESVIQAYLSDVGEVVNFFDDMPPSPNLLTDELSPDPTQPVSWARTPDYVISGSIYIIERDNRVFTLEIHDTGTRETTRSTSVHKTASDLALKARSLARSLVESVFFVPASDEKPEPITENSIAGTWRGESGIVMIRLQPGGRGVAFFSSSAQMNLTYTIEDNILKVKQDSPNSERFYHPLPYDVARQLTTEAEPMCWELLLYSGGNHLKGIRISTEAKIEDNVLVELLPGTERESLWVRSGR